MRLRKVLLFVTFLFFIFLSTASVLTFFQNRKPPVIYERLGNDAVIASDPAYFLGTKTPKGRSNSRTLLSFSDIVGALGNLGSSTSDSDLEDIDNLFDSDSDASFECIGGQDPDDLETKDQLLAFAQGPCLPVVLVPGFLGTKLSVKIDCETFQANHPDYFKQCGWDTCSSFHIPVFQSKPDDVYTLWISDFLGPLSVLFSDKVTCWGNIIQLYLNADEPDITKRYVGPAGIDVQIYGVHSGTDSSDDEEFGCGFGPTIHLLPEVLQTKYSQGLQGFLTQLGRMGYQPGLTLYTAPYDWRKTTLANQIVNSLDSTVRQINQLTGKPTVLIGHSQGNLGILTYLNSLSSEDKSTLIANYVSIASATAGSPKVLKIFVGGDQDYVEGKYGVNYYAQESLMRAASGLFDLVPKDIYDFFYNATWLQEWVIRANYEAQIDINTDEGRSEWEAIQANNSQGYTWFPTPLNQCFNHFKQRPDACGMYMYNWSNVSIATINGESFTAGRNDIINLFNEYVLTTNMSTELFADSQTNNLYQLINPEVPVTIIFGSHLNTEKSFQWDYDPKTSTINDQFAFPSSTVYTPGDETIPTTSSLLPALKWGWEFDNQNASGVASPKPIKVVEICSIYNNKGTIYDNRPDDQPYSVNGNEYIGMACDCQTDDSDGTDGGDCDHGSMINDSKLLAFISAIVNANYKISDVSNIGANTMSSDDIENMQRNCPTKIVYSNNQQNPAANNGQ